MHSRKKGKSGSKKPIERKKQSWVNYTAKEVEFIIAKLAKEGKTASEIGIVLRDTYGIPDVRLIARKKVSQILGDKKLSKEIPDDLMALIKRSVFIRKHLEKNKHDEPAKRGLTLTESKIKRLIKYYKKSKKLAADWKYDAKQAELLVG